jgi:IS5 family transposase
MEEAVHYVPRYRQCARLDCGMSHLPAESTVLPVRKLSAERRLSLLIMDATNAALAAKGSLFKRGAGLDATLSAAPRLIKSKDGQRCPDMHQNKKGSGWHFLMKDLISIDADSGLVHGVIHTAANVIDLIQGYGLLHGEDSVVFADPGDQGLDK